MNDEDLRALAARCVTHHSACDCRRELAVRYVRTLAAARARLEQAIRQHRVDTMHRVDWPTSDEGYADADCRLWSVLDDNEEAS